MSNGESDGVLLRRRGPVSELVFNRPEHLNAIDQEVAAQFRDGLTSVGRDPGCRCLVITGAGRGFSSGQALPPDDDEVIPADVAALVRERYSPLVTMIGELPFPVVAAVNGVAAGAGFALALAADLRVASVDAWFSCAFAKIGLVPDCGSSFFLTRYLGFPMALQLALTGERIDATLAEQLGLVTKVFSAESFEKDYQQFADQLAAGPTRAYALTKRSFRRALESSLLDQLELEATLQQEASETADFREGLVAFREKRPPKFHGC